MEPENDYNISFILAKILESRREKNKHYSARAFARDLGISSGRLSDLLTKKYVPGPTVARRIIQSLNFSNEEALYIQQLIEKSKRSMKESGGARQLLESEFEVISDWHHFAILNLMDTCTFKHDSAWVAGRLGLPEEKVLNSLDTLRSLGLIEESDGKILRTNKNITTSHNVSSAILREAQKQIIHQSLESLEKDHVDIRDITSITFAINPKNLSKAKEMTREFRRKLATLLEEGTKTEVYNVCIQIVPVTR